MVEVGGAMWPSLGRESQSWDTRMEKALSQVPTNLAAGSRKLDKTLPQRSTGQAEE